MTAHPDVDGLVLPLRVPCACGSEKGVIRVRGGQNSVWCVLCGTYAGYNAPKTATGQRPRSVSTVRAGITPAVRAAVLERARGHCEMCGADLIEIPSWRPWHVEHLLPPAVGIEEGLTDEVINGPQNLAAFCEECNLGYKKMVDPLLWLVILHRRLR